MALPARPTGRGGRLATVAAVVLAALAATVAAPAGAAAKPGPSVDSFDSADSVGFGLGSTAARRARLTGEPSGSFLYRKGRYWPLAAIPGAAPLRDPRFPGAITYSAHLANNNRGQIAGIYVDAVPGADGTLPPGSIHGFIKKRRGRVTPFDVPDAVEMLPQGINNAGQVSGSYLGADGLQHGFVRDRNGRVTSIDVGSLGTKVRGLNDDGDVVGIYGESAMNELGFVIRGFLRGRTGRITTIAVPGAGGTDPTAVNDRGEVVGFYTDVPLRPTPQYPLGTQHGFLWDSGRVTRLPDPPGSVQTQALDINDRGQIVGVYSDSRGRQHGFLFERGRYRTIDAPRPIDSYSMGNIASNINDRGQIVIPEPITRVEPPLEQ